MLEIKNKIVEEKGKESLDDEDEHRVALNYSQYISALYRGEENNYLLSFH